MGIYENISNVCREKGISILSLETELGLPRSSICKYNDHIPGVDRVQKIAERLGVSIEDLLRQENA